MESLQDRKLDALKVVCLQHTGAHADIGKVYRELHAWLREKGASPAGPGMTVFLTPPSEYDAASSVFEVCVPVSGDLSGEGKVSVKELPACTVAYAPVTGPYHEISAHYSEILAWLSAQGMEVAGPPREVYIKHPDAQGGGDPAEFVTEIQFPIEP